MKYAIIILLFLASCKKEEQAPVITCAWFPTYAGQDQKYTMTVYGQNGAKDYTQEKRSVESDTMFLMGERFFQRGCNTILIDGVYGTMPPVPFVLRDVDSDTITYADSIVSIMQHKRTDGIYEITATQSNATMLRAQFVPNVGFIAIYQYSNGTVSRKYIKD